MLAVRHAHKAVERRQQGNTRAMGLSLAAPNLGVSGGASAAGRQKDVIKGLAVLGAVQ